MEAKIETVHQLSSHFLPANALADFYAQGKYFSMTIKGRKCQKAYASLLQKNNEIGSSATLVKRVEIPDWLFWVAFNFNQDYILLSTLGSNAEKTPPLHLHTSARADVDIAENWK